MTIGSISTLSLRGAVLGAIARTQERLGQAAVEASTGRRHDAGLALGATTARVLDVRQTVVDLDAIAAANGLAQSQLSAMQTALSAMIDLASGFAETVVASGSAGAGRALLLADAEARLATLTGLLSTTSNGAHVFGGTNAEVPPLRPYLSAPASGAQTAVRSLLASELGFVPGDPQNDAITPADLESFLDGPYAAAFEPGAWHATFSAGNASPRRLRIAPGEVAEVPVGADSPGVRKLVSALVAMVELGGEGLRAGSYEALARKVAETASAAAAELAHDQSLVGMLERRISDASDRMHVGRGVLERDLATLEGVDPLKAAARLNALRTQLETSYAITARMQRLSLLEYL
jgi:flagellar hook-associated protein 3 FlgL